MAFEPGNKAAVGANHKKPRLITQKLIAELQDAEGAKLDKIVKAIVLKASEGDVPALKEIFDRVEGKVAQPLENGEGGAFVVSWQPRS